MLKVQTSYKEIWRIAWPIMLSSMANTVINFTDTAFVARVGEKELAASALGGVFYFVMVMIGVAIGIGSQILIARKAGENKPIEIGVIYDNSFIILLATAICIQLLFYGLVPTLMHHIVNDQAIAESCIVYLKARSWGIIFIMILISLRSFYTGIAFTRIITYSTILMMALNVLLNYILTFGHLGFSPLGIFGVGTASAISEAVAAVYAILYTIFSKKLKQFNLFRFKNISFAEMFDIIKLSAPIVLQHIVSMGAWFLFFVLIEKIGSRELAVSNLVRSVYMVLMTPVWGYAQAANSMVSNVIGQGRKFEVLQLTKKITNLSFITVLVSTLFCVLFPGFLFNLSTSDASLIHDAMGSFYVISIGTIIFSISMILLSAVSGTGNTKAAMIIELVNIAVYLLYVYFTTQFFHPQVEIVWVCEIIYWSMMGVLCYWYLKSGKWKALNLKDHSGIALS